MRTVAIVVIASLLSACASVPSPSTPAGSGADAAYQAGNFGVAAEQYQTMADAGRARAEDWYRLGNALAELGRPADALNAYQEVLTREPGHAKARHNLGLMHLRLGVEALAQARSELPAGDATGDATARYLVCVVQVLMGVEQRECEVESP